MILLIYIWVGLTVFLVVFGLIRYIKHKKTIDNYINQYMEDVKKKK